MNTLTTTSIQLKDCTNDNKTIFKKPNKNKINCNNNENETINKNTNETQPKKQLLLNGEIATEYVEIPKGKRQQRRSRSCSQISSVKPKKNKEKASSNQNLVELWANIRRSERCSEKLLKDRKEQSVITNILNNREEGMRIINTVDKGRGVESTAFFEKDSFIVEYSGNLMFEKEAREKEAIYQKDSSKGSYMFYFKYKDLKYCVDATEESGRLGRLLNHSKMNPNCFVKVIPIDNVPRLTIFAKRDIQIGEELVYDYGDRDKATVEANPWLQY